MGKTEKLPSFVRGSYGFFKAIIQHSFAVAFVSVGMCVCFFLSFLSSVFTSMALLYQNAYQMECVFVCLMSLVRLLMEFVSEPLIFFRSRYLSSIIFHIDMDS